MTHFKIQKREGKRFERLVKDFEQASTNELKVAYLQFINALCNSPADLDMRVSIRTVPNSKKKKKTVSCVK